VGLVLVLIVGCAPLPFSAPWPGRLPAKVPVVGWLEPAAPPAPGAPSRLEDFRQGLRDLGYVEGRNIAIEPRYGEGRDELLAANLSDPIERRLIASYARPGGNITGLTSFPEGGAGGLVGKQLELLKAVTPGLTRVAVLVEASTYTLDGSPGSTIVQRAAQFLGLEIISLEARGPDDLAQGLEAAQHDGAEALLTLGGPLAIAQARRIAALAIQHRMASISGFRTLAEDGFLMTFGPADPSELHRRAAYYVDRILKGANPAELPVEQPMRFDLVVNMKTARELGITFPEEIRLQVTEVIDQ
jgi:putative ABC transport system substrate-binding protein